MCKVSHKVKSSASSPHLLQTPVNHVRLVWFHRLFDQQVTICLFSFTPSPFSFPDKTNELLAPNDVTWLLVFQNKLVLKKKGT